MNADTTQHRELFQKLIAVRAAALEHFRKAQELALERRELMRALLAEGFSQADIARELGVSRQAVQKMLKIGEPSTLVRAVSTVTRHRTSG